MSFLLYVSKIIEILHYQNSLRSFNSKQYSGRETNLALYFPSILSFLIIIMMALFAYTQISAYNTDLWQ